MQILETLRIRLRGKIAILGIGNTLKGDDGVGALLASRLSGRINCLTYDCGVAPENFLGKVIKDKPETVVIVDAADFRGKKGEFRVFEPETINREGLFFTHNSSLELVINFLQSNGMDNIIILAIQPKSIRLGEGLSKEVEASLNDLEEWFGRHFKK